jgi:DNA-binding CsgD family transcriptional regulator
MTRAAISGDIIAYTSLSNVSKDKIESAIEKLFRELKTRFDVFGRIIKGDYLECYIPAPEDSLRVALAIKAFIKSLPPEMKDKINRRISAFKTHGIRLAIGIGEITRFDPEKGIIDGEAIYYSGRLINDSRATSDKERIVIKNTMYIKTFDTKIDKMADPMLALLDFLISKSTAKQCSVLYLKLLGNNEEEIAVKLGLNQSTVNKHSTSLGWNAIEKAVLYFEESVKNNKQ